MFIGLASAIRPSSDGALQTMANILTSTAAASFRPSIIGRDHFYVRYGEKEREAVASFDFLQNYCSTLSHSNHNEEFSIIGQGDSNEQKIVEIREVT